MYFLSFFLFLSQVVYCLNVHIVKTIIKLLVTIDIHLFDQQLLWFYSLSPNPRAVHTVVFLYIVYTRIRLELSYVFTCFTSHRMPTTLLLIRLFSLCLPYSTIPFTRRYDRKIITKRLLMKNTWPEIVNVFWFDCAVIIEKQQSFHGLGGQTGKWGISMVYGSS